MPSRHLARRRLRLLVLERKPLLRANGNMPGQLPMRHMRRMRQGHRKRRGRRHHPAGPRGMHRIRQMHRNRRRPCDRSDRGRRGYGRRGPHRRRHVRTRAAGLRCSHPRRQRLHPRRKRSHLPGESALLPQQRLQLLAIIRVLHTRAQILGHSAMRCHTKNHTQSGFNTSLETAASEGATGAKAESPGRPWVRFKIRSVLKERNIARQRLLRPFRTRFLLDFPYDLGFRLSRRYQ